MSAPPTGCEMRSPHDALGPALPGPRRHRTSRGLCLAGALALLAAAGRAAAQPVTPLGSELEVASHPSEEQRSTAVAIDASGGFVVAWRARPASSGASGVDDPGPALEHVRARRYGADGEALGAEVDVAAASGSLDAPSLALAPDGAFAVTWGSASDVEDADVHWRRFDAAGVALAAQEQVNDYATGVQRAPRVSRAPDGSFTLVWESHGSRESDDASLSVQARRFDAAGSALAPQWQVNALTTGFQAYPALGHDGTGRFVVAWGSAITSADGPAVPGVRARRFSSDGAPLGDELAVPSPTGGALGTAPGLAVAHDGTFLVAWSALTSDAPNVDVGLRARRFASDGTALAAELEVDSNPVGQAYAPQVAAAADGAFLVVWQVGARYSPESPDGSGWSIGARAIGATGPLGSDWVVNGYTTGHQAAPSVAVGAGGDAVVSWHGPSREFTPLDPVRAHLQRARGLASLVFRDGFDGATAWAGTSRR